MGLLYKGSPIWEDIAVLLTYGYACYLKISLDSSRKIATQECKGSARNSAEQESGSLSIELVSHSKPRDRDNDNKQNNNNGYQCPLRHRLCDAHLCVDLSFYSPSVI